METEIIGWHSVLDDGMPNVDESDIDENQFLVSIHHTWYAFDKIMKDENFVTSATIFLGKFVDNGWHPIESFIQGHKMEVTHWAKMPKGVHK